MSDQNESALRDHATRALACLDLTSLNVDDTVERIDALCDRALQPAPGIAIHPAAVCIYPRFVAQARARLEGSAIAVAAVANFPLGTAAIDDVVTEVAGALRDGADEIDVVFPFRAYLAGDHLAAADTVERVAILCHTGDRAAKLKVILETGVLHDAETIKAAAAVAVANGADFVKTSTGKLEPAATPAAAAALLEVIAAARREHHAIGLKVAGGVKTVADAATYLDMADAVFQPGGADPSNFRFGASGLLNDIVAVLGSTHAMQMSTEY
ncbi:MAG TPA: deoxyribose-phosphate aldolase [Ilumatobacteraceae bacterium]|jgi:deoxyribose-phosphate aldolase